MARIKADGQKLVNCGEDIIALCDKYDELIDGLYAKLKKLPDTCWSGDSAKKYVSIISKDKALMVAFGKDLKQYGKAIRNAGNNVDYIIEKWDNK